MSYIVRLYHGRQAIDAEFADGAAAGFGGAFADAEASALFRRLDFRLTPVSGGWEFYSREPVVLRKAGVTGGTLRTDDVLLVDPESRIALTVFPGRPRFETVVNLEGLQRLRIGRDPTLPVAIASGRVSSKHAELYREGGVWHIRDLGSANGTYVNGFMTREAALEDGAVIDISLCRLILSHSTLIIRSQQSVTVSCARPEAGPRAAGSADAPCPYAFKRSPRLLHELPKGEIEIQTPPGIGSAPSINWLTVLLPPVAMALIMVGMVFLTSRSVVTLYYTVPMTLVSVIVAIVNYRSQKKNHRKLSELRVDKYHEYLQTIVREIEEKQDEQRIRLMQANPPAQVCVENTEKMARELWDRRPDDEDFMTLRVGSGETPFCVPVKTPKQALTLEEDPLLKLPGELTEKYRLVKNCPITFDLLRGSTCGVIGSREAAVELAQTLLVHAAAHHCYTDLKIVLICSAEELPVWAAVRWLPHVFDDNRRERYIAADETSAQRLLAMFEDVLAQRSRDCRDTPGAAALQLPYYLFVCADAETVQKHGILRYLTQNSACLGVGAIFLTDRISRLPKECSVILEAGGQSGVLYKRENSDERQSFQTDRMPPRQFERFARAMAPIRAEEAAGAGQFPVSISFLQGYGVKKPQELDLAGNWANNLPNRSMAVPIGVRQSGEPFRFDIHEKASGPHGLVAGMTGSGKSEMVQSWILSMALRFSPQAVSFVLIDFKGTGLILPFRNLPHLAGTISDLDTNIGRNLIALENELSRRKALLDQYGVSNISAYLKLYYEGKAETPLSYLFIVIDEFAEFKVRFPDFMQVVDRVFAIGRTLGVHIILLTQKPANVVNDKMNANTRFRWCLKVASSADSRDMLHHPDAAKITCPGRAYVQVGEDEIYEQIQSYWSGAPYDPTRDLSARRGTKISRVGLDGKRVGYELEKTTGFRAEENEIDAIVSFMDQFSHKNGVQRARSIWTQQLPEEIYPDDILSIAFDGEHWNRNDAGLVVPVGMTDDPHSQSQYPFRIAFSDDGHFALYGAPGTGKTTFLQTAIMSLALSYSPEAAQMYIMDFGGGSLSIFSELPQVGGAAVAGEDEKIKKLAAMLGGEMTARRKKFSGLGVVSLDSYREASGEKLPYIVLVLDNFGPVLGMYPELETFFIQLTRDGGSCGVYLLLTVGSIVSLPYRIAQNIRSTAALRMVDKSDYAQIVGRTNGLEPKNCVGRGLAKGSPPLEFQTALPAAGRSEQERIRAIRRLASLMSEKWHGERPAAIPVMPELVTPELIHSGRVCLGLAVSDTQPVPIPQDEPFLLVSGLPGSGKSGLLRALAAQFLSRERDAGVVLLDVKNSLAGDRLSECRRVSGGEEIDRYLAELMPEMNERRSQYLKDKTQSFRRLVILADDLGALFEAVSNDSMNRLAAIVTLGRGLNVALIAAGSCEDIAKLYHGGDRLTALLADKAPAVLLGGSFQTHAVFKANVSYTEAAAPLGAQEGYLLYRGSLVKMKTVFGK